MTVARASTPVPMPTSTETRHTEKPTVPTMTVAVNPTPTGSRHTRGCRR
ncbi:hypothetical protein [Natronosalvus caseinilyticus]|nr:hypothetical protein [Natronosalvus caseinilyticus]